MGDVKQSIYGFRGGAEVEVFKGAMDDAQMDGGYAGMEDLGQNFRSIDPLVQLTNYVLAQPCAISGLVTPRRFEVCPPRLIPGRSFTLLPTANPSSDARRWQRLILWHRESRRWWPMGEQLVCEHDRETGELVGTRPVRYKDIAVLLKPPAGWRISRPLWSGMRCRITSSPVGGSMAVRR